MSSTTLVRGAKRGIRAARWFDGETVRAGPVLVLVENGRIVAVEPTGAAPPSNLAVDDLGDATLLPGLIDTHTHLVFDATAQAAVNVQTTPGEQLLAQMRTAARSLLSVGVTTARDLGDRDFLSLTVRDETAVDAAAGPTLLTAGPPLTSRAGHCWFLGGEVQGVDGIAEAIGAHADRGADVIKVMATGGRMTPTTLPEESQFSAEELRAAADGAHRRGLPIAAHAHGRQGIVDALAAGFDTLEHVSFMTADGFAPDQEVIDRIAASGVFASVTAGILPGVPLPPPLAASLPDLYAYLTQLVRAGVRITFGCDGGISPFKPHAVLPYAISQLAEHGLAVRDALAAATSTAAAACRLEDRVGRVAVGYDADLLAVAGDVFTDVTAIHRPVAVYRRGTRVNQPPG